LKQTELRLEIELAQEQAERIRKEAEFRRLKSEIELKRNRTEFLMELLKFKAMSSGCCKSKCKEQLQHREGMVDHNLDEPVTAGPPFPCLLMVPLALIR